MPLPVIVFLAAIKIPYFRKDGRVFIVAADGRTVLSAPVRIAGDGNAASPYYETKTLVESTSEVDDLCTDEIEAIRLLLAPARVKRCWYVLPVVFDEPNGTGRLGEIPVIVSPDGKGLVDLLTSELIELEETEPAEALEGYGAAVDGPARSLVCARWTGRAPRSRYDQIVSGACAGHEIVGHVLVPLPSSNKYPIPKAKHNKSH